ncbi:hypothetical protein [Pseudomonas sp. H3(2019)]|uniref:hypothetical protein n=1 Tax=Pseudomonas sp. H3(2019) TaxID=2598724 RepID=UPI001C4991B0|nr:hypothetical protein [Pseudomonas sp. H3(2019)]
MLIGLIGVGNVAGRLFLGSIGDRMGARRLLIVLTFALVLLNLLWLGADTFITLALFAICFGGGRWWLHIPVPVGGRQLPQIAVPAPSVGS